jgi:tetratricopeptide (TPR) repeat protein
MADPLPPKRPLRPGEKAAALVGILSLGFILSLVGKSLSESAEVLRALPTFKRGITNYYESEPDNAIKLIEHALAIKKNMPLGHLILACAHANNGSLSEASTALQRALWLNPHLDYPDSCPQVLSDEGILAVGTTKYPSIYIRQRGVGEQYSVAVRLATKASEDGYPQQAIVASACANFEADHDELALMQIRRAGDLPNRRRVPNEILACLNAHTAGLTPNDTPSSDAN